MKRILFLACLVMSRVSFAGSIAFLGDSLSTGGGAHPYLALDQERFKKIFSDEVSLKPDEVYFEVLKEHGYDIKVNEGPLRLHRSSREYEQAFGWFIDRLWTHFSSRYIDSEEYAWPYLLSKKLGYADSDIWIAARDGEKAMHAIRQVDRVLDHTEGKLPSKVFVFFSGNDLCGPSKEYLTLSQVYKSQIQDMIDNINRNGTPAAGGTDVYLVDPVGVLQIVTSKNIASHVVRFAGKDMSCREVHKAKPGQLQTGPQETPMDMVISLLAQAPAGYCPSLISVASGNSKMQVAISNRLRGYRKGLESLANANNKTAPKGIRYHHISATKDLLFEGKDMANDCFHLAIRGQLKIANAVKDALAKSDKAN